MYKRHYNNVLFPHTCLGIIYIYIFYTYVTNYTIHCFYFCFKMSVIFWIALNIKKIFTSTNIFTVSCIFISLDNPNFSFNIHFFCLKQFLEDILQCESSGNKYFQLTFFFAWKNYFHAYFEEIFSLNIKLWVNMFINKI